jgi:hypothetical protein
MPWAIETFDESEGLLEVVFQNGNKWIHLLGELSFEDRKAFFLGIHIQGPGANTLGPRQLLELRDFVKGLLDVDEITLVGALRTTGANPYGHPRPIFL